MLGVLSCSLSHFGLAELPPVQKWKHESDHCCSSRLGLQVWWGGGGQGVLLSWLQSAVLISQPSSPPLCLQPDPGTSSCIWAALCAWSPNPRAAGPIWVVVAMACSCQVGTRVCGGEAGLAKAESGWTPAAQGSGEGAAARAKAVGGFRLPCWSQPREGEMERGRESCSCWLVTKTH